LINIAPNPFSPDNDGFEDFCVIEYHLHEQINFIRLKIFDSKGRLVRSIIDNLPTGNDGNIIFDGRDDNGETLPLGIYILLFEDKNSSGKINKIIKPLVIARKLH
jgi:flagellar hook assembly protein FlgD